MPASSSVPIVVAIINTNPEVVRVLRVSLERAGFVTFAVHLEDIRTGEADMKSLLEEHDPRVVVYDLAPPYDVHWRFLDHLRKSTHFGDRRFVLTSVNVRAAQRIVHLEETVYEVVGKDADMLEVVRAVKEASRARPTR